MQVANNSVLYIHVMPGPPEQRPKAKPLEAHHKTSAKKSRRPSEIELTCLESVLQLTLNDQEPKSQNRSF